MNKILLIIEADSPHGGDVEYDDVDAAVDAFDHLVEHTTVPCRIGLIQAHHFPQLVVFKPMCWRDLNGFWMPKATSKCVTVHSLSFN